MLDMGKASRELHREPELITLRLVEKHEFAWAESGNLPHQFGANRPAGPGDQDRLSCKLLSKRVQIQLHRKAS
jgi:hypothetical protein